jgi:hypothetical protein
MSGYKMDKYYIISLIILITWSSLVLFGLRAGVRQKNRQSIIPLSIAAFFLGCLWVLIGYDEISNHQIGKMDDCGFLGLIPGIITILCTIFGLVALVREENDKGMT